MTCIFWTTICVNCGLCGRACLIQKGMQLGGMPLSRRSSRNVVLWDFCDTWRIFLPDHIAGRFSCSNVTIRTRRGGVRMGVETILLIVILAFAAGFVLDRLAIRQRRFDAAKSKKEQ